MTTVAYDRPVKDLIDELSATGHVTHASFQKTSVTLHHNAGRLSHEGVLNVWKTRPASAHFDVDAAGAVAQYVDVHEYAWAVGDRDGNEHSISIEMCNSTLSPKWEVSETTWKSAARLAGWLFFNVVKARPSSTNFHQHKYWSSTDCAGPYIGSVWSQVLTETQKWYDYFRNLDPRKPTPTWVSPTEWTRDDVKHFQSFLETTADGKWGPNTDVRAMAFRAVAYDKVPASESQIRLVQYIVDVTPDGIYGPITRAAVKNNVMKAQSIFHVTIDGIWGPNTDDHFLRFRKEWLGKY